MAPAVPILDVTAERAAVLAEARTWLGTKFHHNARIKGVGVDCAQFIIGVYCGLGFSPEPTVEPYPVDWFLHQDRERFLEIISQLFVPVDEPLPGDLVLMKFGRTTSHAAILTLVGPVRVVIHAWRGTGVLEQDMRAASGFAARITGTWTLNRWAR